MIPIAVDKLKNFTGIGKGEKLEGDLSLQFFFSETFGYKKVCFVFALIESKHAQ